MRVFAVLLAGTLLTGCAPSADTGTPVPQVRAPDIAVDTPELRALKKQAGIAACRPAPAGGGSNELPELSLPCFGGGPDVRLDRLAGPLVVPVWASWCAPCRKELPFYQRLAEEYGDRLDVLGIDYTDAQTLGAMELLRDTGATFPQVADPGGEIAGQEPFPRMNYLPVVAFLADDGTATVEITAITDYGQLQDLVSEHLGIEP